jgi:hypothetical protein
VVEELEPVVEALFRSIRLRGRTSVHAGAAS